MKNKDKLQKIIERRYEEIRSRKRRLVQEWEPYLAAVREHLKETDGRTLTEQDEFNIAQCQDNALMEAGLGGRSRLLEATYADNIEFLGVQLPVIAALLPSLVLNEIAIVQALDRRQGAVFYLDVLYDTTKGSITAGDTMIGAKTGHATSQAARRYAMTRVDDESLSDDTLAGTTLSGNLDYDSIMLGSVTITDGTETFKDESCAPGKMVSSITGDPAGWVTEAGAFQVTFQSAPASAGTVTASYQYYYDQATNGVPKARINMVCENLTAEDFPLAVDYSVGASIDLEKAHGISLEDEMVKYIGGEIKFEIDHYGIDMIREAAESANGALGAVGNGTWTATPANGQEWLWKKHEFSDKIEKASNAIFAKTLRGFCNFMLLGNNVARVIRQLPNFKPDPSLDKAVPTGPIVLGKLEGRTMIQDPFLTTNRYVAGYRGDNYLFAGFLYAPWNSRHYQVTGNENFVNCGKVWGISKYEALKKVA